MGTDNSVGIVETKFHTFAHTKPLQLESGGSLSPVTVAYETYGRLNADHSNAILVVHALSGSAHAAGYHKATDPKPGWWDDCIGPGKAFDTNRFFIICSNVLGSCYGSSGPSSLNPKTGRPYGLSFPVVTIGDMVRAQVELINHLGIDKLLCVAGGSMGGMQVLEWAANYPDRLVAAIPIATTTRHSPMMIALSEVGRQAIYADPYWNYGDYYASDQKPDAGLAVARMVGHITYLSDASMGEKFGRELRDQAYKFGYDAEFQVESYLRYQGERFSEAFDANTYLLMTRALDYFDPAHAFGGDLAKALAPAKCQFLVLSFSTDWRFAPARSEEMVNAMIAARKPVSYAEIDAPWGHDAFLIPTPRYTEAFTAYMDRVAREVGA